MKIKMIALLAIFGIAKVYSMDNFGHDFNKKDYIGFIEEASEPSNNVNEEFFPQLGDSQFGDIEDSCEEFMIENKLFPVKSFGDNESVFLHSDKIEINDNKNVNTVNCWDISDNKFDSSVSFELYSNKISGYKRKRFMNNGFTDSEDNFEAKRRKITDKKRPEEFSLSKDKITKLIIFETFNDMKLNIANTGQNNCFSSGEENDIEFKDWL